MFCSLEASTFPKALECSTEDIKDVTRLIRTGSLPELTGRRIETEGITYGYVALSERSKRFFVSFNDFPRFFELLRYSPLSQCLGGCEKNALEYGLDGNVDKRICTMENKIRRVIKNLFAEILYTGSRDSSENYDYIFCGYGSGGSLASLAAVSFVKEERLRENQVKVITFSASGLGDRNFAKSYHGIIPLYNDLNFTRHMDIPSHLWTVGLPIEMTAIEGLFEHAWPSKRTLQKVLWGALVAVGTYNLYYYRHKSPSFVPEGGKIINIDWEQSTLIKTLTEVAGSVQQAGQILRSDYSRFSSLSSDKRLFGVLDALLCTICGLYKFCTMTDLSSDDLITSSYDYTKARFRRIPLENYEEHLGGIGRISWFGSR